MSCKLSWLFYLLQIVSKTHFFMKIITSKGHYENQNWTLRIALSSYFLSIHRVLWRVIFCFSLTLESLINSLAVNLQGVLLKIVEMYWAYLCRTWLSTLYKQFHLILTVILCHSVNVSWGEKKWSFRISGHFSESYNFHVAALRLLLPAWTAKHGFLYLKLCTTVYEQGIKGTLSLEKKDI